MNSYEFLFEDETLEVKIDRNGNLIKVFSGENEYTFVPTENSSIYHLNLNGTRHIAAVAHHKGVYYVDIDSMLFELKEKSDDDFAGGAGGGAGEKDKIFAPMPGKVVKLLVKEGDAVKEKQPMVIVEAMKMENQVNSKAAGVVKSVNFAEGDQVDTESPIIELELEEEE